MADIEPYKYRDPKRLMTVLRVVVLVQLAVLAVSFVAFVLQYHLLEDIRHGAFASHDEMMAAATAGDTRVRVLSVVELLVLPVALITFLVWVYRASANAHALGAQGLASGAGMAVGCYFIPFVNLVSPAINMSQVEKASRNAPDWRQQRTWWPIPLWWTLWLTMSIGGYAVALLTQEGEGIDAIETAVMLQGGYKLVEVAAYILLLIVTARISRRQRDQHAGFGTDSASA